MPSILSYKFHTTWIEVIAAISLFFGLKFSAEMGSLINSYLSFGRISIFDSVSSIVWLFVVIVAGPSLILSAYALFYQKKWGKYFLFTATLILSAYVFSDMGFFMEYNIQTVFKSAISIRFLGILLFKYPYWIIFIISSLYLLFQRKKIILTSPGDTSENNDSHEKINNATEIISPINKILIKTLAFGLIMFSFYSFFLRFYLIFALSSSWWLGILFFLCYLFAVFSFLASAKDLLKLKPSGLNFYFIGSISWGIVSFVLYGMPTILFLILLLLPGLYLWGIFKESLTVKNSLLRRIFKREGEVKA